MRIAANYEQLQLWRGHAELVSRLRPEYVTAIRLQPVLRQSLPKSIVDFTIRTSTGFLCVPAVLVDSPQLVAEEKDPLIWPAAVAHALDDERCDAFRDLVIPWLRSLSMGRGLNHELVRHLGSAQDRAAFEEARGAHVPGTAMVEDAVRALAPYVYASRFAGAGKSVIVDAPDGALGAAYLSYFGPVEATLSQSDGSIAERWFSKPPAVTESRCGLLITGENETSIEADATVRIDVEGAEGTVVAAQAYPMDILFTNQTLHGPPVRTFSVTVPPSPVPARGTPLAPYSAGGGSAGKILIGLREDWASSPDADVDSALELARLLRSEGFTVDVSGSAAACDMASYGLVHYFNVLEVAGALQFLGRAKRAGVRTVLTATFQDVSDERTWGAATAPMAIREAIDEPSVERYIDFLERRALLAPGWESRSGRGPFPDFDALVSQALSFADAVIAETQAEADLLASRFGRAAGVSVVPPLIPPPCAEAPRPLSLGRFALVHAPLEPRNNQIFAVRAAHRTGLDLVLAGELRDMEYAARVREAAGSRVFFLEKPTAADLSWLYATASIYLDASWFSFGTGRLQRAALAGAGVAASQTGWGSAIWPNVPPPAVDPASPKSIAAGLLAAKPLPGGVVEGAAQVLAPSAVLRNIVATYVTPAGAGAAP